MRLLFIIGSTFLLSLFWSPVFGQNDSLAREILEKATKRYQMVKTIEFNYRLQTLFLDDSMRWEDSQSNMGNAKLILQKKEDSAGEKNESSPVFVYMEQDKSNLDAESLMEFNASINALWVALRNGNFQLMKTNRQIPYYIMQLESENWTTKGGTKGNNLRTLYIDTVSYVIRSYIQAVQGESSILRTFTMRSIKININKTTNSNPFQINKNMLQPEAIAPEFSLLDAEGIKVNLSDYKGKVVLLDFWYAACKPCIKAAYDLEKLQNKYGPRGLVVLGMNTMDKADKITKHNSKHKITYRSLQCTRSMKEAYKVKTYPSFYVIDGTGKIVYCNSGYSTNLYDDLESIILQTLSNR